MHYNYFRDYDPATGRYSQSDPIGLVAALNTYSYVSGNPLHDSDAKGMSPDSWCVIKAFWTNYQNMRTANTINADKYFHCKANCEAAQCSKDANKLACQISDKREWFDMNIKGDPKSESDADQEANRYGRGWGSSTKLPCSFLCEPYRPRGLDRKY
jgi:uncharacterized protein RhaS with RHS repeats